MDNYTNKTIWIIGASSGIGAALAQKLAGEGANLILSARDGQKLKDVYERLKAGHHTIMPLDVSRTDDLEKICSDVFSGAKRIDSVVFMAGIYEPLAFADASRDNIDKTILTNLTSAFHLSRIVYPHLVKQGGGQIALCASVAGFRGLPNGQPYSATKAALINLAETLRVEWGAQNIDVKIINPGFVRTPLTDKNKFDMPFIIEPDDAAQIIAKGLISKKFEIIFPFPFAVIMKILRFMPYSLYFKLIKGR